MANRLVDSDVFSFIFRRHSLAARYRQHLRGHALAVSFMTAAEVYELGFRSVWGPGRFALLDTFLRSYVIIPSSPVLARRWASVRYERRGQPIGVADAWIAATALEYGFDLVTHNAADFQGIRGLVIITEAGP